MAFDEVLREHIGQLTQKFTLYTRGGFQAIEMLRFVLECADVFSSLSLQFLDMPDEQKVPQMVSASRNIYMTRNPDLPWIGEPLESVVEGAFFSFLLPELLLSLTKSKLRMVSRPHISPAV